MGPVYPNRFPFHFSLHESIAQAICCRKKCETAIIPILVPEEVEIQSLIARFHEEGIFLNGVEFPAVPRDKQRIRASMMATFTKEDLDFTLNIFKKLGKEFGMIK